MLHVRRDPTGYTLPRTTARVGRSTLTIEGHLDDRELAKLRQVYNHCKAMVAQYGSVDTGAIDWDSVLAGAQGVSSFAQGFGQSEAGQALMGQSDVGPYAKLVLDAATQAGPALAQLQQLVGPAAPVVAKMAHPDPTVQAQAAPAIAAILADRGRGVPEAAQAHDELMAGLVRHKDQELAEQHSLIARLRRRLAQYSDPMSRPGVDTGAMGGTWSAVAPIVASSAAQAELVSVLSRAAQRPRQPSWQG